MMLCSKKFSSVIFTNWKQHTDSLALQPVLSFIPDTITTIEHASTVQDQTMSKVKEGNIHEVEPSQIIQALIHALDDDKDEHDSNGDGSVVPSPEYTQSTVETKAKRQLIIKKNSAI
jgi:hypothetical protein